MYCIHYFFCSVIFYISVEKGSYLALDLGGTNFRVLLVTIKDNKSDDGKPSIEMDSQIYKMPNDVITGNGEKVSNIYI